MKVERRSLTYPASVCSLLLLPQFVVHCFISPFSSSHCSLPLVCYSAHVISMTWARATKKEMLCSSNSVYKRMIFQLEEKTFTNHCSEHCSLSQSHANNYPLSCALDILNINMQENYQDNIIKKLISLWFLYHKLSGEISLETIGI